MWQEIRGGTVFDRKRINENTARGIERIEWQGDR